MRTYKKKEKTEDDKPTLFDYINQILLKTKTFAYDKKIASGWMLSHILSHDSRLISFVQKMNLIQFNVPDECVYQYYFNVLPRGKRFIAIPKKADIDEDALSEIMEQYGISKKEAMFFLKFKERLAKR